MNHFILNLVLPERYTDFPLYGFTIHHVTRNFNQFLGAFVPKNGKPDKTKINLRNSFENIIIQFQKNTTQDIFQVK